jgi:hypothetical protein
LLPALIASGGVLGLGAGHLGKLSSDVFTRAG